MISESGLKGKTAFINFILIETATFLIIQLQYVTRLAKALPYTQKGPMK